MDYLLFNETDILERVDEYTLYCHYLGYEVVIGAKYPCPDGIRISNGKPLDNNPSFGVFERKKGGNMPHEFLWKDQSYGYVGDIFDLVQRCNTLPTRREAIQLIAAEFGFGGEFKGRKAIPNRTRKYLDHIKISIKSKPWTTRDLLFWDRGNISQKILTGYYTYVLQCYWMTEGQVVPEVPKSMSFAYRIFDRYQLYFPYIKDREYRFRTDWTEACVPGWHQLSKGDLDLCIITKSMKDVMCLRSFGYEAIACRSENILLPKECIAALKKKAKRILVLFDNDGKHKGDEYEFDKIYVPRLIDTDKDPFDYCDNHGEFECKKMLKSIIYGY
jgi:hypothetical protein